MIMGAPVERWACDLAGPFPTSRRGYVYILNAIRVFSKYIILVPLRDKYATTVARAIMHKFFVLYGAGEIVTDSCVKFRNELLTKLCLLMGVVRCFTTSCQSRTNAVCKCSHVTINSMLYKYVDKNHRDWDEWLPQVAFCYNASVHESTQCSPFFRMHATEPCLENEDRLVYSTNAYADLLLNRLGSAHSLAMDHLQVTDSQTTDWYDKKIRAQDFHPGDEIYILNLWLHQCRRPWWMRRYSDIATTIKKIKQVTNVVLGDAWQIKEKIVHIDKLTLKNRPVINDNQQQ